MPELPEVEYGRKLAADVALGQTMTSVVCADDPIVFCNLKPDRAHAKLFGRRVDAVKRRGKYLWFELDERPWPVFHFGMTGSFRSPERAPLQLESSAREAEPEWPPRFTKIHMTFSGGGELVMTNARRLGRISFHQDPRTEPPISKLGFDPLTDMPAAAEFSSQLEKRRGTLKGLLLNQAFAAGVGNWIADEVLYQAGLDPRRPAQSLSPQEAQTLHHTLSEIIGFAVSVDAQKDRFPESWLFHHRWGKETDAQTARGETIEFLTVAGRTTAWVPQAQS
jgi:formamidopyrimidine-DNA glycosylase